jgi:hypothetical protein
MREYLTFWALLVALSACAASTPRDHYTFSRWQSCVERYAGSHAWMNCDR